MLPCMLLHVIAPSFGIDVSVDGGSSRNWGLRGSLQIVHNPSILRVDNLGHAQPFAANRDPAHIVNLPAAGRIKSALAKNQSCTRLLSRGTRCERNLVDNGVELKQVRLVVVKALGHMRETSEFTGARTAISAPASHLLPTRGQECPRYARQIEKARHRRPLHTKEPVTVASFRTWRGWRENVARNRCLTIYSIKRNSIERSPNPNSQITLCLSRNVSPIRN